jgi:uncharacterized membrane protein
MGTETDRALDDYLRRLAEELDALPPEDVRDIVAEIRSNVSESAVERGVGAQTVLDGYGAPAALATGILADRGMLAGPRQLPDAGAFRRAAAGVIDVLVAGVLLLLTVPIAGITFWWDLPYEPSRLLAAPVMTAVGIAWGWGYWQQRRGGAATWSAGLLLAGIRQVRTPTGRRAVLAKDLQVPRAPAWAYARALVGLVLVIGVWVLILPAMVWSLTSQGWRGDPATVAQNDVGTAASIASRFAAGALEQTPTAEWSQYTTGSAIAQAKATKQRFREFGIDSYVIEWAGWVDYGNGARPSETADATATVRLAFDGGQVDTLSPVFVNVTVRKRVWDVVYESGGRLSGYASAWEIVDIYGEGASDDGHGEIEWPDAKHPSN